MAIVVPDAAELTLLGRIFDGDMYLRMFTNDLAVSASTTVGSFTECAVTGYSAITVTSGSWVIATDGDDGEASLAQQDFNISSATTLYGYYWTDSGETELYFAEEFTSEITLPADGGTVSITIDGFTLSSNTEN